MRCSGPIQYCLWVGYVHLCPSSFQRGGAFDNLSSGKSGAVQKYKVQVEHTAMITLGLN